MKSLIINSNYLVANSFNDTYTYRFPIGSVNFKNDQVAVSSINMYYSWNNISSSSSGSQYGNNQFQYIWIDGSINSVVFPDGYYNLPDINAYFQKVMVSNGHYMTDTSGNYIYFLELIINQTYYAIQINAYNVPTQNEASTLGYSKPSNASWSFPSSTITPQLTILDLSANTFGNLIGFSAGNYPSSPQSSSYSITSNNGVPQITPISSIIMECTLLNNPYSIPSTLLYSFSPNVAYGEQIQIQPPQMTFIDIADGQYNDFTITFKDQNLNRVQILDTNIVIMLTIKNKFENTLKM